MPFRQYIIFSISAVFCLCLGFGLGFKSNKIYRYQNSVLESPHTIQHLLELYFIRQEWPKTLETAQYILSKSEYTEIYPQALYYASLCSYKQNNLIDSEEYLRKLKNLTPSYTPWHKMGEELASMISKKN